MMRKLILGFTIATAMASSVMAQTPNDMLGMIFHGNTDIDIRGTQKIGGSVVSERDGTLSNPMRAFQVYQGSDRVVVLSLLEVDRDGSFPIWQVQDVEWADGIQKTWNVAFDCRPSTSRDIDSRIIGIVDYSDQTRYHDSYAVSPAIVAWTMDEDGNLHTQRDIVCIDDH